MATSEKQQTSTGNVEYNLVSVIYHAIESALSSSIYMTDAQWIGDRELSQFFWHNQQEQRRTADRAEHLLSKRLSQQQGQSQSQSQQSQSQQQGQSQQSQQSQQGQGQMSQGMYGQGQFGQQGQFGGYGQGMYGGGYGYGPGMYGGGYGGQFGGGYGPGMYGGGFGGGQYGGGFGGNQGGMYSGQYGGGQFGGTGSPSLRQVTGTSDVTYDLVSTMYHALETAQTIQTYMQDAQGDQELTQFFQQIHQEANRCADHARRLLAPRLSHKKMRQSQFQGQGSQFGGSYYGGQGSQSSQTVGAGTSGTSSTGTSSTSSGTGATGQTGTSSSSTGTQS